MRDLMIKLGVPANAIVVEETSLHTLENATFTLPLLQECKASRVILVTSPFHQLRTSLTFNRILGPAGIEIINRYAENDDWHPMTFSHGQIVVSLGASWLEFSATDFGKHPSVLCGARLDQSLFAIARQVTGSVPARSRGRIRGLAARFQLCRSAHLLSMLDKTRTLMHTWV